jgi:hypothetical protein
METFRKVLLLVLVFGIGGAACEGSSAETVTCTQCGNGSLNCDGPVTACLTSECSVTGTSLGETVVLDAGQYTLSSPNGTATGTFTVTADGRGLVLRDSKDPIAAELGIFLNACPYADAGTP